MIKAIKEALNQPTWQDVGDGYLKPNSGKKTDTK